jgi:hypothetical protein
MTRVPNATNDMYLRSDPGVLGRGTPGLRIGHFVKVSV